MRRTRVLSIAPGVLLSLPLNVLIWLPLFLVPLAAVAAPIAVPVILVRRRRRSPTG
jgi:hypothetical protein